LQFYIKYAKENLNTTKSSIKLEKKGKLEENHHYNKEILEPNFVKCAGLALAKQEIEEFQNINKNEKKFNPEKFEWYEEEDHVQKNEKVIYLKWTGENFLNGEEKMKKKNSKKYSSLEKDSKLISLNQNIRDKGTDIKKEVELKEENDLETFNKKFVKSDVKFHKKKRTTLFRTTVRKKETRRDNKK